jgi:hypothetical protein
MAEAEEYENRVVAFVDVLGWKEECKKSVDKKETINKLLKATTEIKDYAKKFSLENKDTHSKAEGITQENREQFRSIEFSFFSDNFAVSTPIEYVKAVVEIVKWGCDLLLNIGFLTRGAITSGLLHHADDIIFGPALVEAVNYEKQVKGPFILCSSSVIDLLEKNNCKKEKTLIVGIEQRVVNVAVGAMPHHKDQMMVIRKKIEAMIADKEPEKYIDNWRYAEMILPKMHDEFISRKAAKAR